MKVSNILQNAVNNVLQKMPQSVEKTEERPIVQKVKDEDTAVPSLQTERQTEKSLEQKVNIPDNFKPLVGLTAREQAFFEDLFPKARREIRAYIDQQQEKPSEKGALVDVKG